MIIEMMMSVFDYDETMERALLVLDKRFFVELVRVGR